MSALATHYAWCNDHAYGEDDPYPVLSAGFCSSGGRWVGTVMIDIGTGTLSGVPGIMVYNAEEHMTSDQVRLVAAALVQAADDLDRDPLPDRD